MRSITTRVWRRRVLRAGLLAWGLALSLVIMLSINPHAAVASPLQKHGALQRHGAVGIIAHRGAAAIAPENTLAATKLAIDLGADFVEVDVQLTADGVPVLMHDPSIDRTTSGSGLIAGHTLAQIQALDAGSWFSAEFAGEQVPTLEQFVDLLEPAPTSAFIEFKGHWGEAQVAEAVELLRSKQMVNRVVLQSFEPATLRMMHEAAPEYARMMLTRDLGDAALQRALEFQVSAVGARAKLYDESPETAAAIRALGMGALVYTLNEQDKWVEAVERGNDLIITDDPVALAEWRDLEGLSRPAPQIPGLVA